MLHHEWVG